MSKEPKISLKLNKDVPESLELIAASIVKLSEVGEAIKKCALNERAITLLLRDATDLPMVDIRKILDALPQLKKRYVKQ